MRRLLRRFADNLMLVITFPALVVIAVMADALEGWDEP